MQDTSKRKEVGLQFYSLNLTSTSDFNLIYKIQKKENTYRRYRLVLGSISYDDRTTGFSSSFALGREKRYKINDRFSFISGYEFQGGLSLRNEDDYNINASIGKVIGFQYAFKNNFLINIETVPSITANYMIQDVDYNPYRYDEFTFELKASYKMSLGILYRF